MKYYCDNMRHLVCKPYSIQNLHLMASNLNIHRCWFHNVQFAHYDIPKRRIEEVQAKCQVVDAKTILAIIKGGM